MSNIKMKQLNPFEIKTLLNNLLAKINSVQDIQNCLCDIDVLDAQEDKTVISKLLFKELSSASVSKIPVICFLLEHFVPKQELISGYWSMLNNKSLSGEVKITVINLLRELDSDWSFENCEEYIEDAEEILDESTRQLLNNAVINPETQIDFMDFLHSIKVEDQITLINSFGKDFSDDALANILIPVFESAPNSSVGKEALRLLGQTKSQLALPVLSRILPFATGELNVLVRKSLAELKMSGIRTDNTKEFYSKILSGTKPNKFYLTYPDGHGDMAMIFTRVTKENKIRFVSIVINIDNGIKDCFGFYEISQFECDKILERFLRDEKVASLSAKNFLTILYNAENITIQKHPQDWEFSYEYICWKNLLIDIDYERESIEQILKAQIEPKSLDVNILSKLREMKVSVHWFLDGHYSDEFESMIQDLKNNQNPDELVEKYQDIVFYPEEKQSWINKLLMCAYIKYAIDKVDESAEIYGLAQDNALIDLFLKEILKRSIYEYLLTIKFNKDENNLHFTDEEISSKIKYIESKWVSNV